MAEKGGSSTATGVDFEAWVGAVFLSEALLDDAISVKLQAKMVKDNEGKEDKPFIDDIVVFRKGKIEFYDCKYRAPHAGQWTYTSLKDQGVLYRLKEQYIENPTYELFLATESPCPLIAEAFVRSGNSETVIEARERLKYGSNETDWDKTRDYLGFTDDQMIGFTSKVSLFQFNPVQQQRDIIFRLKPHITQADSVPVCLKDLALQGAKKGKRIGQNEITDYLKNNGVNFKSPIGIDEIIHDFEVASATILNIETRIGQDLHIPRDETRRLLEWIESSQEIGKAACLVGRMGVGKTTIIHDLYEELKDKSIPVLVIKSDQYTYIKNSQELFSELSLKDNILKLVSTVTEAKNKCIVIFDQLDALSNSLSKERTPLNIIINLINNLVIIPWVNVVISCRKFDLDQDPILSQIKFDPKIEVQLLSADQAKEIINRLGIPLNIFTDKQIELFRTPLYLHLLSKVYEPSMGIDAIQTLQDLYGKLWDKLIGKGSNEENKNKIEVIYVLVDRMDSNKELTVPVSVLDLYSDTRKELLSNGILVSIGTTKLEFFHQSFFDYCFARRFAAENKSLSEKILSEHQGLFIRSQVKQTLSFLRGADPSRYIKELKTLLYTETLRYHIKDLVIALLGNQSEPVEEEKDFVREMFQQINCQLRDHFLRNVDSPAWFDILNEEYIIPLIKDDERIISFIMAFYLKILNYRTKEIFTLMEEVPDFPRKIEWSAEFLFRLENWSDEAVVFYKRIRIKGNINDDNIHFILGNMYKKRKTEAFYLLLNELDSKIEGIKTDPDRIDKSRNELIDWHFLEFIKKAFKDIPDIAIKEIAIRIKCIVDFTKWEDQGSFYRDRAFLLYEQGETLYNIWQLLNEFLECLKRLIKDSKYVLINEIILFFKPSQSVTLNRILSWIYLDAPMMFLEEAYELLSSNEALLEIDGGHLDGYDTRKLLTQIYPFFDAVKRQHIDDVILQIDPVWERKAGSQMYRGKSQYRAISAIPEEYQSERVRKKYLELERKFGTIIQDEPKPMKMEAVGSPIPDSALDEMSHEQWLNAFREYDEDTSWDGAKRRFSLKGGVIELSRAFKEVVKKRPDVFYEFILNLLEKFYVSFDYISQAISGFVESNYDYQKIKALILRYAAYDDKRLRRSIISAIEKLDEREPIDSDLLDILADYALNDPEPERELYQVNAENGHYYYGGDALSYGINTVRGSAVMAITHHGFRTGNSHKVFEVLEKVADDPFTSVRSCIIPDLAGMLRFDRQRTFSIYKRALRDMNPHLLALSGRFLDYALNKDNFEEIIPYLRQMIAINEHDANKSVGRIAMIAVLRGYQEAESFLIEILPISVNVRIGVTAICMNNITNDEYRVKCETQLAILINDYLEDIANSIAWHLYQFEVNDFKIVYHLIERLSISISGKRDLDSVVEYLQKCTSIYPEECIYLIKSFVQSSIPNMQANMVSNEIVNIVTGAYLKSTKHETKEMAMDILDMMYKEGFYSVKNLIETLDR